MTTLGVNRLLRDTERVLSPFGSPCRIGLLTNDGARVAKGSSRVALLESGVNITRLFSPEHGISARNPDGQGVPHGRDPDTGIPVASLYGESLRPHPGELQDLDLILVDLQDVGARFYTYLWSLSHMLEVATQEGVPVLILDRPNPLGGLEAAVEGPLPQGDFTPSFLGRWPIPVRHSLTLGEMALLLEDEMGLSSGVEVVPMERWNRHMLWTDTGLPFSPPSPGIPSPESALFYPGTALLEATNVNEGRGTPFAFRWLGAPWLDPARLCMAIQETTDHGVEVHPHSLTVPGSEIPCPGVLLTPVDPKTLRPVALGLHLLALIRTLHPGQMKWTPYPTAVNPDGGGHLSLLLAHREAEEGLGKRPETIDSTTIEKWCRAPGWWDRASPHLLYS